MPPPLVFVGRPAGSRCAPFFPRAEYSKANLQQATLPVISWVHASTLPPPVLPSFSHPPPVLLCPILQHSPHNVPRHGCQHLAHTGQPVRGADREGVQLACSRAPTSGTLHRRRCQGQAWVQAAEHAQAWGPPCGVSTNMKGNNPKCKTQATDSTIAAIDTAVPSLTCLHGSQQVAAPQCQEMPMAQGSMSSGWRASWVGAARSQHWHPSLAPNHAAAWPDRTRNLAHPAAAAESTSARHRAGVMGTAHAVLPLQKPRCLMETCLQTE